MKTRRTQTQTLSSSALLLVSLASGPAGSIAGALRRLGELRHAPSAPTLYQTARGLAARGLLEARPLGRSRTALKLTPRGQELANEYLALLSRLQSRVGEADVDIGDTIVDNGGDGSLKEA